MLRGPLVTALEGMGMATVGTTGTGIHSQPVQRKPRKTEEAAIDGTAEVLRANQMKVKAFNIFNLEGSPVWLEQTAANPRKHQAKSYIAQ